MRLGRHSDSLRRFRHARRRCLRFPNFLLSGFCGPGKTHRKHNINEIHQRVHDGADACKVAIVRCADEPDRDAVVEEHLPVVLAALLRVDHVHLVEPPRELDEVVRLCEPWERGDRVCAPELLRRRWVGNAREDQLEGC